MSKRRKVNGLIQLTDWINKDETWFSQSNREKPNAKRFTGSEYLERRRDAVLKDNRKAEIRQQPETGYFALFVEPVRHRVQY